MSRYGTDTVTLSDPTTTAAGTKWWTVFAGSTEIGRVSKVTNGACYAAVGGYSIQDTYGSLTLAVAAVTVAHDRAAAL